MIGGAAAIGIEKGDLAKLALPASNLNLSGSPGGANRLTSYADTGARVFGQEYLWQWLRSWRLTPNQKPNVFLSGDSTTDGGSGIANVAYRPANILPTLARFFGFQITATNGGHPTKNSADWLATYLPADLAGAAPGIYVIRWGMNDPFAGISVAQTIANIRSGMASIRATWDYTTTGIVLEMPNTASDDTGLRNEAWREAVRAGLAQAARDHGACFIDNYAKLRDARTNVPRDNRWLDTAFVHPNEDHEMLFSETLAEVLFPPALRTMAGVPNAVTVNAGGWSAGSETPSTYQVGPNVYGTGFITGNGATIATATKIATMVPQHAPTQAYWYAPLICWNGSGATVASNWFLLHCLINTDGTITTMEASAQVVVRCYLNNLCWIR